MTLSAEPIVVAIDGPAGVGKSSVARRLAERLRVPFVDTGALYRCVAWVALREEIDLQDAQALGALARRLPIELEYGPQTGTQLRLAGQPVGREIRSEEVSRATSEIARHQPVRDHLLQVQRDFADRHGGVLEGRDIGTVVFPDTPYKFFLDAAVEERARRRSRQLTARGGIVALEEVRADLQRRDKNDTERSSAPLRCDDSYQVVDTTELDEDQVVETLVERITAIRS